MTRRSTIVCRWRPGFHVVLFACAVLFMSSAPRPMQPTKTNGLPCYAAAAADAGASGTAAVGADGSTTAPPPVLALPVHVRLIEDGQWVVGKVKPGAGDVVPGDVLIAADNEDVSGKSLMDALQEGAGGNGKPFKVLLPVVTEEGGGDGDGGDGDDDHELYPLVGFIRVEFVEPQELVFKAAVGGYHRMKPSGTAAPVSADPPPDAFRGLVETLDCGEGGGGGGSGEGGDGEGEEEEMEETYEAVFNTAGPLGIELATTPAQTVEVKAVMESGAGHKHGLHPGDTLLSVNGEPIMPGETMGQVVQRLAKASWPKTIELRMGEQHKKLHAAKRRLAERAAARSAAPTPPHPSARAHIPPPPRMPKHTASAATPPSAKRQRKRKAKSKKRGRRRRSSAAAGDGDSGEPELGDDEYETLYTSKSLGLEFDATSESALRVTRVDPHGPSQKAGVKVGDVVVRINFASIEDLDFRASVDRLLASEVPRTLRYRRPEGGDGEGGGDAGEEQGGGWLELVAPETVMGFALPVSQARFGGNVTSCTKGVRFEIAEPINACGPLRWPLAAEPPPPTTAGEDGAEGVAAAAEEAQDDDDEGAADSDAGEPPLYVIVVRGACTFPDKAKHVQELGNAAGMIVVSDDKPVVRMPGGGSVSSSITIAALMTEANAGRALLGAAQAGAAVRGRFMMNEVEGCEFDPEDEEERLRPSIPAGTTELEREQGGRMLLWDGVNEGTVPFAMALFGPEPTSEVIAPVVVANPRSGCLYEGNTFKNFNELQHAFVMVERGACSFGDKVRNLQRAKVAGVLVVSDGEDLMVMPAAPPTDDIVTPAVMVPHSVFENVAWNETSSMVGRLVLHEVPGEE